MFVDVVEVLDTNGRYLRVIEVGPLSVVPFLIFAGIVMPDGTPVYVSKVCMN